MVTDTDCNNMAVTVTDTNAKCITIVYDNICGTKYNTIIATVLLLWSYPDNGTKCDTMASNGSLFWSWLLDYYIRFRVVCLSIPSVPTLCFKDPPIGDNTIHPTVLLAVGVIRGNKCWQLKDKKNSPSTINNHLLERIGVAIICPIYL